MRFVANKRGSIGTRDGVLVYSIYLPRMRPEKPIIAIASCHLSYQDVY